MTHRPDTGLCRRAGDGGGIAPCAVPTVVFEINQLDAGTQQCSPVSTREVLGLLDGICCIAWDSPGTTAETRRRHRTIISATHRRRRSATRWSWRSLAGAITPHDVKKNRPGQQLVALDKYHRPRGEPWRVIMPDQRVASVSIDWAKSTSPGHIWPVRSALTYQNDVAIHRLSTLLTRCEGDDQCAAVILDISTPPFVVLIAGGGVPATQPWPWRALDHPAN